ncbi:MAG: PKD domain-containing protein, partial [Thermoplasmatota archaeon]
GSYDKDGVIVDHIWDFGDGITSTADNPTHQYTSNGQFNITLTITDNDYDSHALTRSINVADVKPPHIESISGYPNPQEIKGTVNISCRVTDDVAVSEVRAVIIGLDPNNNHLTENVSMHTNDGTTMWYAAPYNTTGNYSVHIWAIDPSGNSNMSLPYTFEVFRPAMPPEIHSVHITPSEQQAGWCINITCNASDNVALAQVGIKFTHPDGSSMNLSMSPYYIDENSNGIYFYNQSYHQLGTYSVMVWAIDINDNVTTTLPAVFSIIDTQPPRLDTLSIEPGIQQLNDTVNISCHISDNLAVKMVSIHVIYNNETIAWKQMNASALYYLTRLYNQPGTYN